MPLMRHMHQGACLTGNSIPALHIDDIHHRNLIKIRLADVNAAAKGNFRRHKFQHAQHFAQCTPSYIPSTGESFWAMNACRGEQERATLSRQVTPQMNHCFETIRRTAVGSCGLLRAPAWKAGAQGVRATSSARNLPNNAQQLSHCDTVARECFYHEAQLRGAFHHDTLHWNAVELSTTDPHANNFLTHTSSTGSSSPAKNTAAISIQDSNTSIATTHDKFTGSLSSTDLSCHTPSVATDQEVECKFMSKLYTDTDDFYGDMPSDIPGCDLPGSFSRDVSANLMTFDWDISPALSRQRSSSVTLDDDTCSNSYTAPAQDECAQPLKRARC